MVHPVDHIDETLDHVDENIQTIGLSLKSDPKALEFAEKAVEKGVMRCPEIGRMLNFESPWDGIISNGPDGKMVNFWRSINLKISR